MNHGEILSIFNTDAQNAYERLGSDCLEQVLMIFTPWCYHGPNNTPEWREPRALAWLAADKRWGQLFLAHRRHPILGSMAREALRYLPRSLREEVLQGWQPDPVPPEGHEEALAQARVCMRAVEEAADLLAERLCARGWRTFGGPPRSAPDLTAVRRFLDAAGCLPATLQAFWEVVGEINLWWDSECGAPPPDLVAGLPLQELDPLCVSGAHNCLWSIEEWQLQEAPHPALAEPLEIELSADRLHKAEVSGGPPYAITLPNPSHDPVLENESHQLPFLDYLRLAFRWAGFPGLEQYSERTAVQRFVQEMTQGMPTF